MLPDISRLFGSIRGFADDALGSVQDRFELLLSDLLEEKRRLIRTFVWVAGLVFVSMLAVVFTSAALVVAFWNTPARLAVVAGLAGAYVLCALGIAFGFRRFIARQPAPFAATLRQLRRDRAAIAARQLGEDDPGPR